MSDYTALLGFAQKPLAAQKVTSLPKKSAWLDGVKAPPKPSEPPKRPTPWWVLPEVRPSKNASCPDTSRCPVRVSTLVARTGQQRVQGGQNASSVGHSLSQVVGHGREAPQWLVIGGLQLPSGHSHDPLHLRFVLGAAKPIPQPLRSYLPTDLQHVLRTKDRPPGRPWCCNTPYAFPFWRRPTSGLDNWCGRRFHQTTVISLVSSPSQDKPVSFQPANVTRSRWRGKGSTSGGSWKRLSSRTSLVEVPNLTAMKTRGSMAAIN